MPQNLIQEFEVTTARVVIKFGRTLEVASITNDKFEVVDTTASTPTVIVDPFQEIDLSEDYNSISRVLTLHWNEGKLSANSLYELIVSGFEDSAGDSIDDETVSFETDEDISDEPAVDPAPTVTPVVIEDYSILDDATASSEILSNSGNEFYITSSTPADGEYYVENDFENGRVTVTFSTEPDDDYVNSTYFKAQRKIIQRAPVRWETLTTEISKDDKSVFVDYPSIDDDPTVWATANENYFAENYRYRLIISKDIKDTDENELLVSTTINFAAGLSPLYIAPEELQDVFEDATLLDIAEQIFVASTEARDLLGLKDGDEIPILALDYVKAAAACSLSKVFDETAGNEVSFRLGDLSVMTRNYTKDSINRGNAGTWCELAFALRKELIASRTGMKAVLKGANWANPIPQRRIRSHEWRT